MLQRTRQCILLSLILPNCAVCSAPPHLTASGGFTKSRSFSSKVQFTVVQLCSCAVVHPQLRWILTENTFNGTQMAGLREKSVGTGNQIELLYVFFYNKSFESMNTYERYIRFSSNAWLPLIPDPPPPRLFSQLFKIITRVHSQSHPWQPLKKAMCSVWNAATQPYSALHCFSLTSDTQQVFSGGKLFAEWESH